MSHVCAIGESFGRSWIAGKDLYVNLHGEIVIIHSLCYKICRGAVRSCQTTGTIHCKMVTGDYTKLRVHCLACIGKDWNRLVWLPTTSFSSCQLVKARNTPVVNIRKETRPGRTLGYQATDSRLMLRLYLQLSVSKLYIEWSMHAVYV